jgi:hypothetical protein
MIVNFTTLLGFIKHVITITLLIRYMGCYTVSPSRLRMGMRTRTMTHQVPLKCHDGSGLGGAIMSLLWSL